MAPDPHSDRRRLLLGLGALALAPVAVGTPSGPARAAEPQEPQEPRGNGHTDARGYETVAQPSCLADLIESGEVSRGDLVAG